MALQRSSLRKKDNQELCSLYNSQVRQILLLEHGIIPTVSVIMFIFLDLYYGYNVAEAAQGLFDDKLPLLQ